MEYTSLNFPQRSSRAKTVGLIGIAVFGTLVAIYAVSNAVPTNSGFVQTNTDTNSSNCTAEQYNAWKQEHGHKFDSQEDSYRFNIWCETHNYINEQNSQNLSWQLSHNAFSHLSFEEFAATHTGGQRPDKNPNIPSNHTDVRLLAPIADSVDWTAKGAVTPVKDQGSCGSCWTFATTGVLEGLSFITTGLLPSFSEQQLLDCAYAGTSGGKCGDGGTIQIALFWVLGNRFSRGITTEAQYPYKGKVQKCNTNAPRSFIGLKGWKNLKPNSPDDILTAIEAGPVTAELEVIKSFKNLGSGVYKPTSCPKGESHAVLLVGYDKTDPNNGYYILKNSWGKSWGKKGYGKIAITGQDAGICGIQEAVVSVY